MKKHVIALWVLCFLSTAFNVYLLVGLHGVKDQEETGEDRPSSYELQRRTVMVIDSFIVQAQLYTRLKGDFPAGFQDLITPYDGEGRHGPNDAFGRTLKFNVIDGKICIRSAGVDGQFMTDDDIIGEGDKDGPGRTIKSPIGFYTVNYDV